MTTTITRDAALQVFSSTKTDYKPKDGSELSVIANLDAVKAKRTEDWGVVRLLVVCLESERRKAHVAGRDRRCGWLGA